MVYLTLKQTALGRRDHPFSGLCTSLLLAWASDLSLQLLPLPTRWDPLFPHAPWQPVPGGNLETLKDAGSLATPQPILHGHSGEDAEMVVWEIHIPYWKFTRPK